MMKLVIYPSTFPWLEVIKELCKLHHCRSVPEDGVWDIKMLIYPWPPFAAWSRSFFWGFSLASKPIARPQPLTSVIQTCTGTALVEKEYRRCSLTPHGMTAQIGKWTGSSIALLVLLSTQSTRHQSHIHSFTPIHTLVAETSLHSPFAHTEALNTHSHTEDAAWDAVWASVSCSKALLGCAWDRTSFLIFFIQLCSFSYSQKLL